MSSTSRSDPTPHYALQHFLGSSNCMHLIYLDFLHFSKINYLSNLVSTKIKDAFNFVRGTWVRSMTGFHFSSAGCILATVCYSHRQNALSWLSLHTLPYTSGFVVPSHVQQHHKKQKNLR